VRSSPCARFPNSFPKARDHVCVRMGSVTSFLYFVIDSPVLGCTTGAQKCSHVHGMACDVGSGAWVWIAIALSAAVEYSRGVSRAIRGERRGSIVGCKSGSGVVCRSTSAGAVAGMSVLRRLVGAAVGAGGGMLLRVSL